MCMFRVCSQTASEPRSPASPTAPGREGDYTLASLMYAAPSWWGYTSAKDRARADRLVHVCRLMRRGFLSAETPDVATLVSEAENRLFQAIIADPNNSKTLPGHKTFQL